LKEEDTDWKRFSGLISQWCRFEIRASTSVSFVLALLQRIPDQWMVHQIDTVHWFTDLPRPRSVVCQRANSIFGKTAGKNWDTLTAVFDYGPLNDPHKGFQVIYSSRQTNSAGDVKELYARTLARSPRRRISSAGRAALMKASPKTDGNESEQIAESQPSRGFAGIETGASGGRDESHESKC